MSRRVVILQRESDRMAVVAALLTERGHSVVVARTDAEAVALVREQCAAILIDGPRTTCEGTLCGFIRREIRPMPAMVGVLESDDERARPDSSSPGAFAAGRSGVPGAAPPDVPDTGHPDAPTTGRPDTPGSGHPCEQCMVMLPPRSAPAEIVAAVEDQVRWWPGDD
jgi:CheY-like chemotaxis protein